MSNLPPSTSTSNKKPPPTSASASTSASTNSSIPNAKAASKPPSYRGKSFSKQETDDFLDEFEKILPTGDMEWELLFKNHTKKYHDQQRTVDGLRQKFQRMTAPHRDPNVPPIILRAKQLYKMMKQKYRTGKVAVAGNKKADNPFQRTPLLVEEESNNDKEPKLNQTILDDRKKDGNQHGEQVGEKDSENKISDLSSPAMKRGRDRGMLHAPETRVESKRLKDEHNNQDLESFMKFMMMQSQMEISIRREEMALQKKQMLEQQLQIQHQNQQLQQQQIQLERQQLLHQHQMMMLLQSVNMVHDQKRDNREMIILDNTIESKPDNVNNIESKADNINIIESKADNINIIESKADNGAEAECCTNKERNDSAETECCTHKESNDSTETECCTHKESKDSAEGESEHKQNK